jgi:hypothetical protein
MAEAQLRGDLARAKTSTDPKAAKQSSTAIVIGRCTIVACGAVLKPPGRMSRGAFTYYPMKIGDNVFIGTRIFSSSKFTLLINTSRSKLPNLISRHQKPRAHRRKLSSPALLYYPGKREDTARHRGAVVYGRTA